ncbi:hypothetical protein [Pararobbsia silviterrae]|uniref:hypothetical protein n=1 Tax=Pararobbsia silviterrae TaxID=1792498 RepID=UPI0011C34317|nr:hypothetical protein [Pararobbsia silviterrae]
MGNSFLEKPSYPEKLPTPNVVKPATAWYTMKHLKSVKPFLVLALRGVEARSDGVSKGVLAEAVSVYQRLLAGYSGIFFKKVPDQVPGKTDHFVQQDSQGFDDVVSASRSVEHRCPQRVTSLELAKVPGKVPTDDTHSGVAACEPVGTLGTSWAGD